MSERIEKLQDLIEKAEGKIEKSRRAHESALVDAILMIASSLVDVRENCDPPARFEMRNEHGARALLNAADKDADETLYWVDVLREARKDLAELQELGDQGKRRRRTCYNALPSSDELEELYDLVEDNELDTNEKRREVWVEFTMLRRDLDLAIRQLEQEGIEVKR